MQLGLLSQISWHEGDFLGMNQFGPEAFDLVVGKAFLHDPDHLAEERFLRRTSSVLKPEGQARFVEPATNSALLDQLRYLTPVPGRPSSLHRKAFLAWKEADPHPPRDNSSAHFRDVVGKAFGRVDIICIGCLERFHRFLPRGRWDRPSRRLAFRSEKWLPCGCREMFARSQLIIAKEPIGFS